jgi:hypothetical protein
MRTQLAVLPLPVWGETSQPHYMVAVAGGYNQVRALCDLGTEELSFPHAMMRGRGLPLSQSRIARNGTGYRPCIGMAIEVETLASQFWLRSALRTQYFIFCGNEKY